jgi:DNA primase
VGIVDEDIVRVREGTDIVQVISQYTQLKRVGRRFSGLCPFHGEKTPSFSVNAEEGFYYCFGCQAKGDAITFVREKEQLDFVGAVEWLANKANITLRYTDVNEGENRKRRTKLYDAIEKAVDWYHERLLTAPDAGPARAYLRDRGFTGELVREFRIGWAPDDWDALAGALRLSNKDLIDAGLGFINRRNRQQDAFRGRVMFPIFDAQGRAVGFGGRVLPGSDDPAKYKNSAESSVYAKSRVLYGLNWAKTDIVEKDEVVVCEGYTDVIGFFQAGVPRAVATCGTALTDDHVKLLRKFARRVVLSFDADSAGQNAAARFYEWEKSHDLDVAVADLPDGVDPGELAQTDPERLRSAISEAKPFLGFRVGRVLDAGRFDTAEGRAKTAEAALALVAEHPDPLVRDQYAIDIASRCRLEDSLVRRILEQGARPNRQHRPMPAAPRPAERQSPELEALRLSIVRPDEMRPLIVADLFLDERYASTFNAIVSTGSLREAIEFGGPEVGDLIQRLSVEDSEIEPIDVAGRLWQRYLERRIEDCRRQARFVTESAELRTLNDQMRWFKARVAELPELDTRASAVEGLLAWFSGATSPS